MIMYKDAVRMLKESIEAMGPDYVYVKPDTSIACLYVHSSDESDDGVVPGCIVGDLLVRQHILTLRDLSDLQANVGTGSFTEIHQDVVDIYGDGFSDKARKLLDLVQDGQDRGVPWGAALEEGVENMYYEGRFTSEEEGENYIPQYAY